VSGSTAGPSAWIRFTERLRLEPIGPEHAGDLWRLHQDEAVAAWHAGRWTARMAEERAAAYRAAWQADGVSKWLAYDRGTGGMVGRGGAVPGEPRRPGQAGGRLDGARGPVGEWLRHGDRPGRPRLRLGCLRRRGGCRLHR